MSDSQVFSRQQMSKLLQEISNYDIWSNERECLEEHLDDLEEMWDQLDDEVWAQLIILEKNKRIDKVFLRKPKITISNGNEHYDHFENQGAIGLSNFEFREENVSDILDKIGKGCSFEMDNGGNILASNLSNKALFFKQVDKDSTKKVIDKKPFKLFDMNRFQTQTKKEFKKDSPDWNKLRIGSATSLSFVEHIVECLEQPLWMLLINVVALDFLRSRRSSFVNNDSISSSSTFTCEDGTSRTNNIEKKEKDSQVNMIMGHPISWHTTPPVPPVRHGVE